MMPSYPTPADATDCHMHVFGPPELYPAAARRAYTPLPAPLDAWQTVARPLGLTRVVLVQPSAYGADNRCMLDAMRARGAKARGVAVIDEDTDAPRLAALHAAGVRGIRLNLKTMGESDPALLRARLMSVAGRIAPLGWHIQIYADLSVIAAAAASIRALPVPVVFDHMGGARAPAPDRNDFATLLDLVATGNGWVKISGAYRVSGAAPLYADATPIARALVKANPDRIVWGTDWPHIGGHVEAVSAEPPPAPYRDDLDAGALLALAAEAAGDAATFRRILVDNPARLYGF